MTTEITGERSQLAALPLNEKVRLLTGADSWRTHGSDALGLRPLTTSDGPNGVRGTTLDESNPSSCLPCPSALGATWDPALIEKLTAAMGLEARSKGVDILLAPTINLMRTPLGGRGFECFSEDPELTARIAVAYVKGVQSAGVMATVKHYVGNDSETERWTYDARIPEHVLREVYLVPFEAAVREGGAAVVMAAYNMVNGSRMTEHATLLLDVLKREWGFTGVVVSDWDAARSTVPSAVGGLDLAMPGPNEYWGDALADAVKAGQVPEHMVDDKVMRLVRTARRIGAAANGEAANREATNGHAVDGAERNGADGHSNGHAADVVPAPNGQVLVDPALLHQAVTGSLVLLTNDGTLPFSAAQTRSVALIGPNAVRPVIQGGGSARVIPASESSLAQGLETALGGRAAITVAAGCRTWSTVPDPPRASVCDPETSQPGIRLEFLLPDGTVQAAEHRSATTLAWWDGLPPGVGWGQPGIIRFRTRFRADAGGSYLFGMGGVGRLTLTVDGEVAVTGETPVPADPVETMTRPGEIRTEVPLSPGQEADITVEFRPAADCQGPVSLRLGIIPATDDDTMMAEAVTAASQAEIAIVVVGSSDLSESEGYDRETLALPGRQDELVRRVAAVNPRTVVVVNAGMPVLMPWASEAAAIIYAWMPGQAMGGALADALVGNAEPGGRLPVTLPASEEDCPVLHAFPTGTQLNYAEGLLLGYRGYDAAGTVPLFPFGHGLGYTGWEYESVAADATLTPGSDLTLRVTIRNTGTRPGREIVQAYVSAPHAGTQRPVRVLGGFAAATAAAGEATQVTLRVPARMFAIFDEAAGEWAWPPGEFTVEIGRSSRDLRLSASVQSG